MDNPAGLGGQHAQTHVRKAAHGWKHTRRLPRRPKSQTHGRAGRLAELLMINSHQWPRPRGRRFNQNCKTQTQQTLCVWDTIVMRGQLSKSKVARVLPQVSYTDPMKWNVRAFGRLQIKSIAKYTFYRKTNWVSKYRNQLFLLGHWYANQNLIIYISQLMHGHSGSHTRLNWLVNQDFSHFEIYKETIS